MQKVVHLRKEFGEKKTKITTAVSIFYDLDDPNGFLRDVAAVDKNPAKWGRKMVRSIPIVSSDEYRDPPDFLLVLPWHRLNEVEAQKKSFLDSGASL